MFRVSTVDERIAAVLHDVVEDTIRTLATLVEEGLSTPVLAAIDALTKRPGETRMDAAARAAANPIARVVKLADSAENMDMNRLPSPTARDFGRLEEYKQVRELLMRAELA